jgi:Protein of unknown function (DUF664)
MSQELGALRDYLDSQREHVVGILDGLSDEQLRRPVLPSGWSCLGLVHHLALDVERFWFPGVIAAEPDVTARQQAGTEAHWRVPDGMSAEQVLAEYGAQVDRANAVLASLADRDGALDEPPAAWPEAIWPRWRLPAVRHVILHAITEVACHAGHLDAARELLDGTTWMGGDPYAG